MVRQSRNYLAGAISGTALIGMAMVAFVLLVSLGALRDWPLAGLPEIGGGDDVTESSAQGADGADSGASPADTAAAGAVDGRPGASQVRAQGVAGVGAGRDAPVPQSAADQVGGAPSNPTGSVPGGAGQAPSSTAADPGGANTAIPSSTAKQPAQGGGSQPAGSSGGGSSGAEAGGGGGGSGSSTSEVVSGTVNNVVNGVDQATGGALGATGVPQATEEVVNGLVGPESPVGETVDNVVETVKDTVGGLLGGKKP